MLTAKINRFFSSLKLPHVTHTPQPFTGNSADIIAKRAKHFSNAYSTYYSKPLIITEGHMQYLYDNNGNRYLDLQSNGGQVNIGHSHPSIRKIIQEESGRIIHTSTIYMSQAQGAMSKLLLDQVGSSFDTVYLCNSTAQANDFALFISRVFTDEKDIYSYRNAHHGLVGNGRGVTNLGSWTSTHVDQLKVERLKWPCATSNVQTSTDQFKSVIKNTSNDKPGTFIYEPLQSKAGISLPPKGYLQSVVEYFKSKNGITICDQSNTGLSRIGKQKWGFKWQNHTPDIITLGASLGNGSSLGAVVTRKQIASVIKHNWFNTFAAGHMQTKIGMEVINTINRQNLHENAEKIGTILLEGLKKIASKHHSTITAVRGKGLLLGIDITAEKSTLKLHELCKDRQLLFGIGGQKGNTLLVRPPLCINQADAKYVLQAFEDAVKHI